MIENNLNINQVFVQKKSHLEIQIKELFCKNTIFHSKDQLISQIQDADFDILVSNGCPYLLPTSGYKNPHAILINVHPSYLPDLAGKDPVPGALIYKRDSGATCHLIDNGMDTGPIISQIKIPNSKDLDVGLLYQLSFLAEKLVFLKALRKNFRILKKQELKGDEKQFARSQETKTINFIKDSPELICQKILAFGNISQGVEFSVNNFLYRTFSAKKLENPFLLKSSRHFKDLQVIFCYDDNLVFKKNNTILKLERISGPLNLLKSGDFLAQL